MQNEDARVRKTKEALKNALLALLTEKSYSDISINELCERASIRRATFYKHFKDKDDFLFFAIKMFRDSYESRHWKNLAPENTREYLISYAAALADFFWKRRIMSDRIMSDSSRSKIIGIIVYQNFLDTERLLKDNDNLISSPHHVAGMLAGGVGMLLMRWAEDGWKTPKEEIVDAIVKMVDRLI